MDLERLLTAVSDGLETGETTHEGPAAGPGAGEAPAPGGRSGLVHLVRMPARTATPVPADPPLPAELQAYIDFAVGVLAVSKQRAGRLNP